MASKRHPLYETRYGNKSPMEWVLSEKDYFGLKITQVQRAIARAADGHPIGRQWNHPDVRTAFFGKQPECRPREILLAAGIRGGKSMLAAGLAIDRALTCDLSQFSVKESEPILPIVSTQKHNAQAVFRHLVKLATLTPYSEFRVGDPGEERVTIRNQYGVDVRIMVLAGKRAASSLASYWFAGAIFDECFKLTGREDGVVSLEDAVVEVRERVLADCQIVYIGSKWRADGPAYRMYQEFQEDKTGQYMVINATGPMLNPSWWNEERCTRLSDSTSSQDKEIYQTTVEGQFLEAETDLISTVDIEACTRLHPLELKPVAGIEYVAAMDPATRRNAWTLVIACMLQRGRITTALARQWIPTIRVRLDPDKVMEEIINLLHSYWIPTIMTDQFAVDFMRKTFIQAGIGIHEVSSRVIDQFTAIDEIRIQIQRRNIELPPVPDMHRDLSRLVKRPGAGAARIILPNTNDGRHCDYVPPLAHILAHPPRAREPEVTDRPETEEERYLRKIEAQSGENWMERLSEMM